MFDFKITSKDKSSFARCGEFTTPHGKIQTPVFMPVGTQGSVKTTSPKELEEIGIQIILGNTYHLFLRPGLEVIRKFKGLHKFMSWQGPILTDSGGFQVFSLKETKITDKGAYFKSHLDGSSHFIDAKKSMQIQKILGADIIMAFDHCPAGDQKRKYIEAATQRTAKWLDKSIREWKSFGGAQDKQTLFGIVQGGIYSDLRKKSAQYVVAKNLAGNAIGGLAVGEKKAEMWKIVKLMDRLLPIDRPRYLMGVGEPADLIQAVEAGMDMFDCVLPTRIARNGTVFYPKGKLTLLNAKFKFDQAPIQKTCQCYACKNFSRGYIRHLLIAREVLGIRLTTLHNLYFVLSLMQAIRQAIKKQKFSQFKKDFLNSYKI